VALLNVSFAAVSEAPLQGLVSTSARRHRAHRSF
jgi:hypothetical protein